MLHQLLKKLIKTSAGRSRFVMAMIGLTVALVLILAAVQLQANYNELLNGKTNQDSVANFLLVNKAVTNKTIGATTLSETEIADLRKQPFIDDVGVLTPSHFKVSAESASGNMPFYTDLFFESVPDGFLDINDPAWKWDDRSQYIPIVIPNMFLDMYNFGFSASQGLPQLTPEAIKSLPVKIVIKSGITPVTYYAKVVGFSDRVSSVLVPQAFMDWANKNFGTQQDAKPSRVVIRTKDPGNPALVSYLSQHGLTTDTDKTRFSKYRQIVNVVVNASWVAGAVMFIFALLIFTLFIQLTIASCRPEIVLLTTLGTSPRQLYRFLLKQFFPVNIIVVFITLIIIAALQYFVQHFLAERNIYVQPFISVYTIAAGIAVLLVLWIVNSVTIKKYIANKLT
ncbi:MAG: hypothetical protein J0I41_18210 [Filimonas sp.]|nr:hypothetical protein [Filimonas sp.]